MRPKTQTHPVTAQESTHSRKHNAWLSQKNRNFRHKREFFSRLLSANDHARLLFSPNMLRQIQSHVCITLSYSDRNR